jgi:hypothetical protein
MPAAAGRMSPAKAVHKTLVGNPHVFQFTMSSNPSQNSQSPLLASFILATERRTQPEQTP